jgi:hypothetical protein
MASEIITLDGLKKLLEMKESERPKDWDVLVLNYLLKKQAMVRRYEQLLMNEKRIFEEAVMLARKLGVIW